MTVPNQWRARGLECDKMSVEANEFHLKRVLGDMKRNLGDLVGTGLKHVLFDSGHVPPFTEVARETIDWLDRALGPVAPGRP